MLSSARRFLLATAAAIAVGAPGQAQNLANTAAASSESATDIIVTAQKREERLLDVPQSVSVISAGALAAEHAQRLTDYLTRVPSANVIESQAGQARIVLRGINAGGAAATVATYVDEAPYGSATGLANGAVLAPDIDPFDLQRVEVLRGPQGTLYGANSLGGLVKYVTVAPQTDAFRAVAEAGVENVSQGGTGWSGRAAMNAPIASSVAVRLSGFYRDEPGFIDNPRFGKDVNGGDTFGGRASILLKPTDAFTIRGSIYVQNLNSNATNTVDIDPATLRPILGDLKQNRLLREPNRIKYRVYNATLDYDFGPVSLLSSTSIGTLDQKQIQDATGVYGPVLSSIFMTPLGAFVDQHLTQRRITQEVRLTSAKGSFLEWTIGGFYTDEKNRIDQVLSGVDGTTGAAVDGLEGLAIVALPSSYSEKAAFANLTFHFTPMFDLSLGGRYSHNNQSVAQTGSGPLGGDGVSFGGSSSDNVFTYSVAPSFKPNDHTTFYARVAKGYRPGGPNVVPPLTPDAVPRTFEPDTTVNYEVGVKTELLDRAATFELTGFYIDWNNIQLLTSVEGFSVNANGGKARSQGVEFTATATPLAGLTLAANGAYVDAKLRTDAPGVNALRGDRLPYNARFSGTVSADYEHLLGNAVTGTFGVSYHYTGVRYSGTANASDTFGLPAQRPVRLPAFGQLDAHAGIEFGQFRLDGFVRNLTDSRGILNLETPGSAPAGVAAAIVRPRSFGATLGIRY